MVSPPPLPPQRCFCYIAYTVFYHVLGPIDKYSRPIQRYIAKTSHMRLPTHLDD